MTFDKVDSYTEKFVDFSCATQYEDLPASAVAATKVLLRDTLGCAVGGREAESSRIVAGVLEGFGGAPQATSLVSGVKLPVTVAAHINAHSGNALDADDTLAYKGHIASVAVAAALAMAEREGSSGRDLLAAITVAYDVAGRIGMSLKALAIDDDGKFRFGPVSGYSWISFAATVATGRLLGLDPVRMHHAFGITAAIMPLPSSTKFGSSLPRPMTKYAMYGTLVESGMLAALYAREGFTAQPSILDGDTGVWRVLGALRCDWTALTAKLGEDWLVEQVSYKIYPTCRFLSGAIDNFYRLMSEHRIDVKKIDRVKVGLAEASFAKHQVHRPEVAGVVDGAFSLPYALGAAAFAGEPGPAWHSAKTRQNEAVQAFGAKVEVEIEPTAAGIAAEDLRTLGYNARMPCSVEITAAGRTYAMRSEYARGDQSPGVPLTEAEHERKFRIYCARQLPGAQIEDALGIIHRLEREPSPTALAASLTSPRPNAAADAAPEIGFTA